MKTIKELNKALNEKQWYRFLKILWLISYPVFMWVTLRSKHTPTIRGLRDAIIAFFILTFTFLGVTALLKRSTIYALDYISNGKILLKEKWYSLLLIVLWGIFSIVILLSSYRII